MDLSRSRPGYFLLLSALALTLLRCVPVDFAKKSREPSFDLFQAKKCLIEMTAAKAIEDDFWENESQSLRGTAVRIDEEDATLHLGRWYFSTTRRTFAGRFGRLDRGPTFAYAGRFLFENGVWIAMIEREESTK